MALLSGACWLSIVLLWCSICFLFQNGYNTAYGYYLDESPKTSSQIPSGDTKYNHEAPVMRPQSFASPQAASNKNGDDSHVTNEGMVQSQTDSVHVATTPPVQEYSSSGNDNPFGLLLKEHTQNNERGISFPTINHFEAFIRIMKSSFLTPGTDSSRHFQSAREVMKNVIGESSRYNKVNSITENTALVDNSKNKVWRTSNQIFDENLIFPEAEDSSTSLISSSTDEGQELKTHSALSPESHLTDAELVSHNLINDGFPEGQKDIFESSPENKHVQSTHYKQPEQMQFPSGSILTEGHAFSGHVTVSPVKSPSSDNRYDSHSIQPKSTSNSGFERSKDFHRFIKAPQKDNLYSKRFYAPTGHFYIPDLLKHKRHRAQSDWKSQSTVGKEAEVTPDTKLPVSTGSVSNGISPESLSPRQVDPVFTVRAFGSPFSSTTQNEVEVSVNPSIQLGKTKDKSDLYEQNLVSSIQEPNDHTLSNGRDSARSGITSHGAGDERSSFLLTQKRGISPYMRVGLLQQYKHPTKKLSSSMKKYPQNTAYWPSEQLSAPKHSPSKWINLKSSSDINGLHHHRNMAPLSVKAYFKSKNKYTRATTYLSKTSYTPYLQFQSKATEDRWKLAEDRRIAPNPGMQKELKTLPLRTHS